MQSHAAHPLLKFSGYQKFVVAILAFLQFTIILDFMIISPLGAILMPALLITPAQFGTVVSVYAFSAGCSGLLAAGFADRYDRKKLLLFFYAGFLLGTLFCGLAPTYHILLGARMVTGMFGGVLGSIVMAITTDLFPLESRGRVMGLLQTSFAASQVLGIPVGLFISNLLGWHAPFLMIVVIGLAVGMVIWLRLRPIDAHLKLQTDRRVFEHLKETVTNPNYTLAFALTTLLSLGGFMLMPFGSAFTVNNMGIAMEHLPTIYLVTGLATLIIGPTIGRLSDRYGKFKVFVFGGILSIILVLIYTHMGITPLPIVMLVNVVMFVSIFSRMIPSQALISAIPAPANRGSFMSITSSLQQISGGFASLIAGLIVTTEASGKILNFDVLGYIMCCTLTASMVMMYFVHRKVHERIP